MKSGKGMYVTRKVIVCFIRSRSDKGLSLSPHVRADPIIFADLILGMQPFDMGGNERMEIVRRN